MNQPRLRGAAHQQHIGAAGCSPGETYLAAEASVIEVDDASHREAACCSGTLDLAESSASHVPTSPSTGVTDTHLPSFPVDACTSSCDAQSADRHRGGSSRPLSLTGSRVPGVPGEPGKGWELVPSDVTHNVRAGKQPTRWTAAEPSTGDTGSSSGAWLPGMPKRLLHVFSGPGGRVDGLRQMMRDLYSMETVEVDTLIDPLHADLLRQEVFDDLIARCAAGEFFAAVIGTPCSTFSVARIFHPDAEPGPPQVRDVEHPDGMDGLSLFWQLRVAASNLLVERSVAIARAIQAANGVFVIENPATRSDSKLHLYRWRWRSHASLWMHSAVRPLVKERWTRFVTFPQCALGGAFQKWTSLLYSEALHPMLASLGTLTCTHAAHAKSAAGRDPDGKWRSAEAAAYPAEMNAMLVHACVRAAAPPHIFVGSKRPHATTLAEADGHRPEQRAAKRVSLRRLDPEVVDVLRAEPLPAANVPPTTAWHDGPAMPSELPAPLRTDQLISLSMQQRLLEFRAQVATCFAAARAGRWKWARDHRPRPLHASEEECLLPAGRGWVWSYDPNAQLWHPVSPSKWPESPPTGELDVAIIVQYARDAGYSDMEIISFIAHGYPGPELARETVLGPPHVGALREVAAFDKAAAKDRTKGWVRAGFRLPPLWPMRADPMNIVFRNGKPRMTIDKSMRLVYGVDAYNDCIDLSAQPAIDYVSVVMLGRAGAILASAGVRVRWWGFDLEAYFRKTGKQAADVWMSGFVHSDGYGVDERVQFGQREAPVLCGRQSCFITWAIKRELRRLDLQYAVRAPAALAWLRERAARATSADADGVDASLLDTLFFVCMYVDDVGGASFDDDLFAANGDEWWTIRDGERVRMTRSWLHFDAALGVIRHFGHSTADDKVVPPCFDMVYLGVTLDFVSAVLSLSIEKCQDYKALIATVLERCDDASCVHVHLVELSAIIHRLLHASAVIPLGRQHLFHLMRAAKTATRLEGGARVLGAKALFELRWWAEMLGRDTCQRGVPLAFRCAFPASSDPSTMVPYSDASRERGSIGASGFGAWAVLGGVFCYVEGRWTEAEVELLDINTLELAAMNIGTFTLLAEAARRGLSITHVLEFTDNTSAEHAAEGGKPKSASLGELVRRRYVELHAMHVTASCTRVASVDNDIADGLSRGGSMLADALRMAASTGMPVVRLDPLSQWRSTEGLRA